MRTSLQGTLARQGLTDRCRCKRSKARCIQSASASTAAEAAQPGTSSAAAPDIAELPTSEKKRLDKGKGKGKQVKEERPPTPTEPCQRCVSQRIACTYDIEQKKRGPPPK